MLYFHQYLLFSLLFSIILSFQVGKVLFKRPTTKLYTTFDECMNNAKQIVGTNNTSDERIIMKVAFALLEKDKDKQLEFKDLEKQLEIKDLEKQIEFKDLDLKTQLEFKDLNMTIQIQKSFYEKKLSLLTQRYVVINQRFSVSLCTYVYICTRFWDT